MKYCVVCKDNEISMELKNKFVLFLIVLFSHICLYAYDFSPEIIFEEPTSIVSSQVENIANKMNRQIKTLK